MLNAGRADWLLRHIGTAGDGFTLLAFTAPGVLPAAAPAGITRVVVSAAAQSGALHDHSGLAARRFEAQPGTAVLLRPDQHVCAHFAQPTTAAIAAAHDHALGIAG